MTTDAETGANTAAASADEQRSGRRGPVARFFRVLGPGLVTGAADDDPSGVATYAQAGATYQNGMLWTVPLSLPLMIAVQEITDRTAFATGESLGRLIRRRFRHSFRIAIGILLVGLILANVLNLAADLMAIGAGAKLLGAGPAPIWTAVAGVAITSAVVFGSFGVLAKVFKWLCLVLFTYVVVLFVASVDWADVLIGLTGAQFRFTPPYLGLAVAVLGTTISPYMFFWQSAQRIEQMRAEEIGGDAALPLRERTAEQATRRLRNGRIDVITGMAFSVLVMFSIIAATAATLGREGRVVSTAADAARALQPIAGNYAEALFAIGFIGSGVLAVPVLAASGAAGMAGLLDKRWGFDKKPRHASLFYVLLTAGIIGGIILGLIASNPISLLVLSAIINGIAAGPFLVILMLIADNEPIMGEYRNHGLARVLGWTATAVMCVAGAYGVWFTLSGG